MPGNGGIGGRTPSCLLYFDALGQVRPTTPGRWEMLDDKVKGEQGAPAGTKVTVEFKFPKDVELQNNRKIKVHLEADEDVDIKWY